MPKYCHFAELMVQKRLELGFKTSKKFHASLPEPPVEYQSWTHVESGRRLPKPNTAMAIAACLDIAQEEAILAYTRDIFQKEYMDDGLKHLQDYARAMNLNRLIEEADLLKRSWHTLSTIQWQAIAADTRLHDIIAFPFPRDHIHVRDLATMIHLPLSETIELASKLKEIGLLHIREEVVSKIYKGVIIPQIPETLPLRKKIVMGRLSSTMKEDTRYRNYTVNLSEDDLEQVLKAFELIDAKCIVGHDKAKQEKEVDTYNVLFYLSPVHRNLRGRSLPLDQEGCSSSMR